MAVRKIIFHKKTIAARTRKRICGDFYIAIIFVSKKASRVGEAKMEICIFLLVIFFVFDKRFGKLIGAGSAVAALHALKSSDYVVDLHADGETGNALRVAAAAVYELQRLEDSVLHFVNDLATASADRSVRFHCVCSFRIF